MSLSLEKLSTLSPSVHSHVERELKRLAEAVQALPVTEAACLAEARVQAQLPAVLVASDYVARQLQRHPALLGELVQTQDLWRSYGDNQYHEYLQQHLSGVSEEPELMKILRVQRRREMVRIIWRDSTGLAKFAETARDLSNLADACIELTLEKLYALLEPQCGRPHYKNSDRPMPMVVLGMGKLGAQELNLSSDIDLMFVYAHDGETTGGARSLDHLEYFLRLGQRLIKVLDENTADGFVFRVDMRLRPFGASGPLAMSFLSMENYYEDQGREWERYAMIKARAVG
ncbi:MAG TPA: DUF294 nucleotidyltransferase-like domain-containing protein, partial [Dongiaceae bacterium]|nr:DUF294 nucleotidyltransferase-like domain-containing protein [Dongiaceae bacterium]